MDKDESIYYRRTLAHETVTNFRNRRLIRDALMVIDSLKEGNEVSWEFVNSLKRYVGPGDLPYDIKPLHFERDQTSEELLEYWDKLDKEREENRIERKCDIPPIGWKCTRERGHDGPCAAVEE